MSTPRFDIVVSSGEPGGIGPDLCIEYSHQRSTDSLDQYRVLYLGDPAVFAQRAKHYYDSTQINVRSVSEAFQEDERDQIGVMRVLPISFPRPEVCGRYHTDNAPSLLRLLNLSRDLVSAAPQQRALVTGPVQKSAFYESHLPFVDHTSWLEQSFPDSHALMLLHADALRVCLYTVHIPLHRVATELTRERLSRTLRLLSRELSRYFGYARPNITVTALNPHAGDHGLIGLEEQEIIIPVVNDLKESGLLISGPLPADSLFTMISHTDAFLCLYHDQGLPLFKALAQHSGVNITLGLPIIRTSVDHGTALDLAGQGKHSPASFAAAIHTAVRMLETRQHDNT